MIARLSWCAWGLVAGGVILFSGRSLLSDLNSDVAVYQPRNPVASTKSLQAAQHAVDLAPWKSRAWAEYSRQAILNGDPLIAVDSAKKSVYWSLSDPEKWLLVPRAISLKGYFDLSANIAVRRIAELTPNAPSYRRQLAVDGIFWWDYGDRQAQAIWQQSIAAVIQEDSSFLKFIVETGHEQHFCVNAGAALDLSKWCAWSTQMSAQCLEHNLNIGESQYCTYLGFRTAQLP